MTPTWLSADARLQIARLARAATRCQPYRAGDEFDLLDVDGTLESLAMSGKSIDQISDEISISRTPRAVARGSAS